MQSIEPLPAPSAGSSLERFQAAESTPAVHYHQIAPLGYAPCPHCGHLLWYVSAGGDRQFLIPAETTEVRERVLNYLAEKLGVSVEALRANPQLPNKLGADSFDTVELVTELEEEFGDGH